jgi:hypothetical protein
MTDRIRAAEKNHQKKRIKKAATLRQQDITLDSWDNLDNETG